MSGFGDIANRMRKVKDQQNPDGDAEQVFDYVESYRLRSKMLGVLIRDARLNAARTIEDCARLLNIDPAHISAWEYGESVPDLPQLELLAYYLDVHVSHFWGMTTLNSDRTEKIDMQGEYMALRHRMIGALLQQAREEYGKTIADIAATTHIPAERVQHYENGTLAIPMNELSAIGNAVNKNVDYFLESGSYIGTLLQMREEWKHFIDLDEDVRQFAANPLNIGFIKIAMLFSEMPAEQLRRAAEGMLEIAM
ncbi:MAG: helix-turn-helix domain-containing protein [Aggregatilineales bacterium]